MVACKLVDLSTDTVSNRTERRTKELSVFAKCQSCLPTGQGGGSGRGSWVHNIKDPTYSCLLFDRSLLNLFCFLSFRPSFFLGGGRN